MIMQNLMVNCGDTSSGSSSTIIELDEGENTIYITVIA